MRTLLLAALLVGRCAYASAQSAIVGDAWILGKVSVGTTTAGARFFVLASSSTEVPFQVSGVDLTPFIRVGRDGTVGLSTYSAAHLDASGTADSADMGLMLRSGDLYGAGGGRVQIAMGANGSTSRRHTFTTVHVDSTALNSLDMRIWTPDAGTAADVATMTAASLVSSTAAFAGGVHVMPVGAPTVELTVSNGLSTGGGTLHAASVVTPSSRRLKSDVSYLAPTDEEAALARVRGLRHASFRYMKRKGAGYARDGRGPVRRGLIYEEAPDAIKGPAESLSLQQRLVESELAFKALARKLEALEREAAR
ncbi:MAG: tail fiber domain-containing protein [Elusimicrobiota bacterium]|nr:tail fiber domain-containing protein [Elusimicrobiota bacterium]